MRMTQGGGWQRRLNAKAQLSSNWLNSQFVALFDSRCGSHSRLSLSLSHTVRTWNFKWALWVLFAVVWVLSLLKEFTNCKFNSRLMLSVSQQLARISVMFFHPCRGYISYDQKFATHLRIHLRPCINTFSISTNKSQTRPVHLSAN